MEARLFSKGDRVVFVYPHGYVFGIVLAPKTKQGLRMRLVVVDDGATHPETGDRQTTRIEYHPDWGTITETYGITNKTNKLVRWKNPIDGIVELWSGGIPYFLELYDPSKEPYRHDTVHDW